MICYIQQKTHETWNLAVPFLRKYYELIAQKQPAIRILS